MRKKTCAILIFTFICMLTVSCESSVSGTDYRIDPVEYGFNFSEKNADLSYETPQIQPGVLVDQMGYEPGNAKTVIFSASDLGADFTVRDAETRETVYTGAVKSRAGEGGIGDLNYFGDFSDFTVPGTYYIQVDKYGESYPFMIHDSLYYSMFQRAFQRLHELRGGEGAEQNSGWRMEEKGSNKEIGACRCMYRLMLSYELFPEIYTDEMGIEESGNGVPDILDECRYEADWLIRQAQESPEADARACGWRCLVLARCGALMKPYDAVFARQCQQAAAEAWKQAAENAAPEDLCCLAASELYRCTGKTLYAALAENYLTKAGGEKRNFSELEFYAATAYMNTRFKVSLQLCETLIKKVMAEAEQITENSRKRRYLVYSEQTEDEPDGLLDAAMRICVVNHVITNHEYNKVIENYFHYLMGCNPQAVCYASYWDGQTMKTEDLLVHPVRNAAFLFMLSELLGNQS